MNLYDIEVFAPNTLHDLFASATRDASAAMCGWTNGLITVALDRVREVPLEEVGAELGLHDELLTMVVLTVEGDLGGSLVLLFDEHDGRQLAASLLGREPGTGPEWSELEQSALAETGNILGCAYVNALARLIGADLVPSVPWFIQDYGASVVQQAVAARALTSDRLLLCQVGFRRQDQELAWRIVFIPTQLMQEAMQHCLTPAFSVQTTQHAHH